MKKYFALSILVWTCFSYTAFSALTPTSPNPANTVATTPSEALDTAENTVESVATPFLKGLESFRLAQAEHFATLRDKTKIKLGLEVSADIMEKIKPYLTPPTSAPSPVAGVVSQDVLKPVKLDNPGDYAILVGATAMASLFGTMMMFYAVLVLLTFLVLRWLFKLVL